MPLPSLSVRREYAADTINDVVNHPQVRPWVGTPGQGYIDLTPVVADPRNYLLMGTGGGFVFHQLEPGIYEAHSQFVPESRGANVLTAARDALYYMFTRTDCIEVRTKVPHGNVGAAVLGRKLRFELQFERDNAWPTENGMVGVGYYAINITQWTKGEDRLIESGHAFHQKLESAKEWYGVLTPIHDDDEAHDRYVGATVEMFRAGQIGKALGFYTRWAQFAGYGPISIIAENPIVIDIGDALIALRGDDYQFIMCRS